MLLEGSKVETVPITKGICKRAFLYVCVYTYPQDSTSHAPAPYPCSETRCQLNTVISKPSEAEKEEGSKEKESPLCGRTPVLHICSLSYQHMQPVCLSISRFSLFCHTASAHHCNYSHPSLNMH